MKKFIFILLIFSSLSAEACDVCGCGVGGYYSGILPQFQRNFVGIRYQFRQFVTHPESQYFRTEESYQTAEVWARYQVGSRLQISGFLPYRIHEQQSTDRRNQLSGMGDPLLILDYVLLNSADSVWKKQWRIGGGIKAPLGNFRYNKSNPNETANPNFQLGTGTWDFVLRSDFVLRRKRSGLSLGLNAQLKGNNPNNYRFGDSYAAQIQAFTIRQFGKFGLMPRLTFSAESARKDRENGKEVAESGGNSAFAGIGTDFFYKSTVLGFSWEKALSQNLSAGFVQTEPRWSLQLSFVW